MGLKIIFMGTPDFAVPVLDAILKAGHRVVAVYSQPPRPAGRGMAEQPSPVHRFAAAHGLKVLTPRDFKSDATRQEFAAFAADAAVVVAYGLLLPEAVLKMPTHGCFNVHASELPRWRGAAPIQRAIMAGDVHTAVAVMCMEKGLDTGPVALQQQVPIPPGMTAGELHDVLARHGASLMVAALAEVMAGTLHPVAQPADGASYAAKIGKAEARIDFAWPAEQVAQHILGLSPFPGAWFEYATGSKPERIKVLRAVAVDGDGLPGTVLDDRLTVACGTGAVRLTELQRAGKEALPADVFLRGFKIVPGARLA